MTGPRGRPIQGAPQSVSCVTWSLAFAPLALFYAAAADGWPISVRAWASARWAWTNSGSSWSAASNCWTAAASWYRRAADQDLVEAQIRLGSLYRRAELGPDLVEAHDAESLLPEGRFVGQVGHVLRVASG